MQADVMTQSRVIRVCIKQLGSREFGLIRSVDPWVRVLHAYFVFKVVSNRALGEELGELCPDENN